MGAETESEQQPQRRRGSRLKKRLLFLLYLLVVSGVLVELGMRVLSRDVRGRTSFANTLLLPLDPLTEQQEAALKMDERTLTYVVPDARLGWTVKPSGASGDGLYRSNRLGLRALREVSEDRAPGVRRTLIVGDSFAHGDEVAFEDTWFAQLEQLSEGQDEYWCGGVPGYGTDQAILRLDDLIPPLKPDRVVLTIYRMNLVRNLTFFRVIQSPKTGIPMSKPRFLRGPDGALTVENSPTLTPAQIPEALRNYGKHRLGRRDDLYDATLYEDRFAYLSRVYCYLHSRRAMAEFMARQNELVRPGGLGFDWGLRLGEEFGRRMKVLGIEPVIVLLPDHADLEGLERKEPSPMAALAEALRARGLRVVNTEDAVLAALAAGEAPTSLFVGGTGHPNPRCSQVLATHLHEALRQP
ncbi:MAG TPA: SGNH/GDSL hydrolase family protein [Planctomycetota bacterium]|jgi:hypothetical protein|nr:SGNH/GDSL hydrolase family protein [Planctomycetota bacterium]